MKNFLNNFIVFSFLVLLSNQVFAKGMSAIRQPGQIYLKTSFASQGYNYPESQAVAFRLFDFSKVEEMSLPVGLEQIFSRIRDDRYIKARPFDRRPSYLYPDDGCFARAEMMNQYLELSLGRRMQKVFAFGNLQLSTANSITGAVGWWYHVAPITKVGNEVFVLDPSIEPMRPILLQEWLVRMSSNEEYLDLEVALCDSTSYSPSEECFEADSSVRLMGPQDQKEFLDLEWRRVRSLGRSPEAELKDLPPWKTQN